jgi:hypothetical protein
MTTPPRVAAWLLEHVLAVSERDAIVGDLSEEFSRYILPTRGTWRARWWYRWQVARSLAPLFFRSWERASLRRASTAVILAAAIAVGPASALVMLRTFVLQQVPLKTTAELSVAFRMVLAAVVLIAGGLGVSFAIRLLTTDTRQR